MVTGSLSTGGQFNYSLDENELGGPGSHRSRKNVVYRTGSTVCQIFTKTLVNEVVRSTSFDPTVPNKGLFSNAKIGNSRTLEKQTHSIILSAQSLPRTTWH